MSKARQKRLPDKVPAAANLALVLAVEEDAVAERTSSPVAAESSLLVAYLSGPWNP